MPYEERQHVLEHLADFTPEDPFRFNESTFTDKNGELRWSAWSNRAFFDDQGELRYFQSVGADVTERKRAEEALRESEEKHRRLFETMAQGVIYQAADGTLISANPAAERILGLTYDQMCGKTFMDPRWKMIKEDGSEVPGTEHPAMIALHTGEIVGPVVRGVFHPDKKAHVWLSIIGIPLFQPGETKPFQAYGTFEDITERKLAIEALQASESFIKLTLDNLPVGVAINSVDPEVRFNYMNDNFVKFYRTTREELAPPNDFWEAVYQEPEFRKKIKQRVLKDCASGDPARMYWEDIPVYRPGQKTFYITAQNIPLPEKDLMISTVWDVTNRKIAEQGLRESEERYRKLINTSPDAIALVDEQGRFLTVNPAMARRFDLPQEELAGRTYHDVMPKNLADKRIKDAQRSINQDKFIYFEDERQGRYLQNYYVPIAASGQQRTFQVISRDITERKNIEEELKYLSLHDQLTGLYNRVYLENELQRLQNSREFPITIICMDLDGLKLVNDSLGHDQGDKQLRGCARILQESFRASDIVARFGGDEFVALLPRTDQKVGQKSVNRIRSRIKKYNQQHSNQIPLSLSIGSACAKKSSENLLQVFKQADDLMYRDKLHRHISSRSQVMRALMASLEERDFITSGHAHRLEDLCFKLGKETGISVSQLSDLNLLAQVHDLGKVGIPDQILFKPGPLTAEEWHVMRQHPEKGYRIAQSTTDLAGIADFILKHHERWDGKGYPLGIAGEQIPIECRILAIVDAFDAMTSDRPYRQGMSVLQALEELKKRSGFQLDPQLVKVFLEIMSDFYSQ